MDVSSFDPYSSELCVFNNVSLKFLKEIYVREPAFEDLQRSVRALNKYSNAPIIIFLIKLKNVIYKTMAENKTTKKIYINASKVSHIY